MMQLKTNYNSLFEKKMGQSQPIRFSPTRKLTHTHTRDMLPNTAKAREDGFFVSFKTHSQS